jgi:S1-C subfamily serine protease
MLFSLKKIILTTLSMLLFTGISYNNADDTYKWVDKDGVVHFSDRTPDDQESIPAVIHEKEYEELKDNIVVQLSAEKPETDNKNPLENTIKSTFTIKGSKNIGTGFFISPDGYAITCKHVIEVDGIHTAILNNQEEFPIGVISKSSRYDLALILVTTHQKVPYLKFRDPLTMEAGDRVYAVGSSVGLQSTITDGLFTALRRQMPSEIMAVQFSAPVNPGNSGGPLTDKNGKVIGAISWKLLSDDGGPVSGIGFAVPSEYILNEYRGYTREK